MDIVALKAKLKNTPIVEYPYIDERKRPLDLNSEPLRSRETGRVRVENRDYYTELTPKEQETRVKNYTRKESPLSGVDIHQYYHPETNKPFYTILAYTEKTKIQNQNEKTSMLWVHNMNGQVIGLVEYNNKNELYLDDYGRYFLEKYKDLL